MSASISINAEFDRVRIECDDGEDTIWIRTQDRSSTVALTLSAKDLDALESAIATARASLREPA